MQFRCVRAQIFLLKIFWIYKVLIKKNFVSLPQNYKYAKTTILIDMVYGLCPVGDGRVKQAYLPGL